VDVTIAGLVDTGTARTGWMPVTSLVDAGTSLAIATAMGTTHLLNFLIKGMMEVRGANYEKIEGDQKERTVCGLVQETQGKIFLDTREGQTASQPKTQNLALRYQ
jgi:hypothetical protein